MDDYVPGDIVVKPDATYEKIVVSAAWMVSRAREHRRRTKPRDRFPFPCNAMLRAVLCGARAMLEQKKKKAGGDLDRMDEDLLERVILDPELKSFVWARAAGNYEVLLEDTLRDAVSLACEIVTRDEAAWKENDTVLLLLWAVMKLWKASCEVPSMDVDRCYARLETHVQCECLSV